MPGSVRTTPAQLSVLAVAWTMWMTTTATAQHKPLVEDTPPTAPVIPTVTAVYRDGPVSIDGRIDEAAWMNAVPATRFVQREPVEGAPAEERTEVRVLFDEDAIYVGAVMHESQPHLMGTQLVRRDEFGQYDYFAFSVDSNNDRRTAYRFQVSAAGVQRDEYLFNDVDRDDAWDAVWESAVHRSPSGWSAELRIPLSQLRYFPSEDEQSWGVNFTRRRLANNELTYFALESRVRHGRVSVFGRLTGLRFPKTTRRMEFRPYALSKTRTAPATPGNPFFDGSEIDPQLGLDMRYGIGSSHTLDVTINPDFGQVEVDPAVINLSAFETFFPEKRPFFVEDAQIFDFSMSGRDRLFYSRRIGREPRGSAPDGADFDQIPDETTIIGAAKLTGRSENGFSIGALAAVTGEETGQAHTSSLGVTQDFIAEPRTQYGVVRGQQDLRDGGTVVGGIATLMRRELPDNGAFDFLPSSALGVGVDFQHNWGGPRSRDWALWGYLAGSYIRGSNEALIRIQRSSNHYFQRPDATRLSVDSTATAMDGFNWRLQFERQSAQHWTGAIWFAEVTPGFEVNDLGFSTSAERIDGGARIRYREITPGNVFRNYSFNAFTFYNFTHEALDDPLAWRSWSRAYKSGAFFGSADFEFLNYWELETDIRYTPTRTSDNATRGGPLMKDPARTSFGIEFNTDRRRSLVLQPQFNYDHGNFGEFQWETGLGINVRPTPSWEFEFEPRFSVEQTANQYVATTDDIGFAPTFGPRYIFSDLKRRSFSLESRMNIAFTPKLTLQWFAQPLLSSGDYLTYKSLQRPESFDFDVFEEGARTFVNPADGQRHIDFDGDGVSDFSFSDRDFNIRSLRLNMVVRWEYRPGSTVFFVWQQSRRNEINDGTFRFGRDFGGLLDADPENIFIVKLNYWFGV